MYDSAYHGEHGSDIRSGADAVGVVRGVVAVVADGREWTWYADAGHAIGHALAIWGGCGGYEPGVADSASLFPVCMVLLRTSAGYGPSRR